MEKVIVEMDAKGRLAIPKRVRKRIKTKRFVILIGDKFVRIVPKVSLRALAGIAPGLTTENLRDETDRVI